ncbi:MAG: ATP-dependent helicase HrpB [Treponema sp.]|nr:ATP-dependent helicase HrpB [Treponema sp.]
MMYYPKEIESLPISFHLDAICTQLKNSPSHFLVLTAETAAGKSTAVPIALMRNFSGGIVMLEPRRLAVLNIAQRVSSLLHEEPGKTCGYVMQLEQAVSKHTRFTVLTEAILTRKLQSDPSLEGISVVVIDEFHERSVHADMALAFLKEAVTLRDDLFVLVMSATMETKRLCSYLNGAPLYEVPGRQFPVHIHYAGKKTAEQVVLDELRHPSSSGSVLVFLPGIAEIRELLSQLVAAGAEQFAELLVLHSSVPFSEQKKVLKPSSCRRVILSTSIAETSLTVPDVTVVIDSGLVRMNMFNRNVGMETLVTRQESVFNAAQRAGRAGRTAPGICIRLWHEHDTLSEQLPPEILRTDLLGLVLECAEWGVTDPDSISWLDAPPNEAWQAAQTVLQDIGCIDGAGQCTDSGRVCLHMGLNPRLGCVVLSGIAFNALRKSVEIAAEYSPYARSGEAQKRRFTELMLQRVQKYLQIYTKSTGYAQPLSQIFTGFSTVFALLCGFPDRIARLSDRTAKLYQFPSGRMAILPKESVMVPDFLIAPEVDAGEIKGIIHSMVTVENDIAQAFLAQKAKRHVTTEFISGTKKLKKTEYTAYGAIVLKSINLSPSSEDFTNAVCSAVQREGIFWLPLSAATKNLLLRVQFFISRMGTDICKAKNSMEYLNPNDSVLDHESLAVKFETLKDCVERWLVPFLPEPSALCAQTVHDALYWYLDGKIVCKHVPSEIQLTPNSKPRRIVYEKRQSQIVPTVEIIIQQAFGCLNTPHILGEPVVFKLLSPARRPLQITSDLEHFWSSTWPQICSEMKGRYPKHNWDYRKESAD